MQQRPRTLVRASATSAISLLLLTVGAGQAGARPLLGTQHEPPRFLDESSTYVTLGNVDDGYGFQLRAQLVGYSSEADTLRLDWKQGGKLLASAKCKVSEREPKLVEVTCDQRDRAVTAKGAVEAELIYKDDADDKEYLVRTFKLTVTQWAKDTWQLEPDDLLGAAYAIDRHHQTSAQDPHPRFRFWVAAAGPGVAHPTLRCKVNGKPLPELPAALTSSTRIEADIIPPKGERTTWRWSTFEVEASTVMDGRKGNRADRVWLADHPGDWACFVRLDGRNVRELLFRVNAKGAIESHPMQAAPGAAPLAPGVSLIDIRIPADAALDQRIKPDRLKKSRGFGLPWPADPSVQAIHAAFPPQVAGAKPVAAAKPAGKLLAGSEHSPPRFVDESTTSLALARNADGKTDGYKFRAYALVAGATSATDRVRLDWKQAGKLVATTRCQLSTSREAIGEVMCEYEGKPLTAKGAIDAELVYSDDADGNDYLVRTYKVTVAKYPSFGDAVWQLVPDDLLGGAWVRHEYPQKLHDGKAGHPHFWFWVAEENPPGGAVALRCTVDGAKLPDIQVSIGGGNARIEAATHPRSGKGATYAWVQVEAIADVYFGKRSAFEYADGQTQGLFLAEHPGAWTCQLRREGSAFRELRFTVDKSGFISSELQAAQGAVPALSNVAAVDLRFPKAATPDQRVRPAAMKKSRGFGLAWPQGPVVQAIHATFPAAGGLPDPK